MNKPFNPSRPPLTGGLFKNGTRWKPSLPSVPEVGNQAEKNAPQLIGKKVLDFPSKPQK